MAHFKSTHPLETRRKESSRIIQKYPERIPVIVERSSSAEKTMKEIDRKKYLVPASLNWGEFLAIVRNRLKLESSQSIFMFVGNDVLVSTGTLVGQIYEEHKDKDDGFLYAQYASENTFGWE